MRDWYARNRESAVERVKERQRAQREKFLAMYGGCCALCGETRRGCLSLDHVLGDGAAERGTYANGRRRTNNYKAYSIAVGGLDPSRYRILCMNCQFVSRQDQPRTGTSWMNRVRLRVRVFAAYGRECSLCGFDNAKALQLDHVDGGGTHLHRTIGGERVYTEALRVVDRSKFRILCANCNWVERRARGNEGGRNYRYGGAVPLREEPNECRSWGPLFEGVESVA